MGRGRGSDRTAMDRQRVSRQVAASLGRAGHRGLGLESEAKVMRMKSETGMIHAHDVAGVVKMARWK
eukprot:scaffold11138_cov111-Isochrysis_galbana.AAC.10